MLLAHVVVAVQSLSRVWLWLHGLQFTRLLYLPLSPRVCSNSSPLIWWYHTIVSSSAALFFCLQSFPASGLVFSNELAFLTEWAKVLEFQLQHQSFQWIFRVDFLWDWLLAVQGTLKSLLQHHTSCYYDAVLPHSTQNFLTVSFKD